MTPLEAMPSVLTCLPPGSPWISKRLLVGTSAEGGGSRGRKAPAKKAAKKKGGSKKRTGQKKK